MIDLTEEELRKSILWNQSSVVRFDDDRLDDIMTVKVEEIKMKRTITKEEVRKHINQQIQRRVDK